MKEIDLLKLEGVREFVEGDGDWYDIPIPFRDTLYEFYQPEMPYGIQKARTGDPDFWIQKAIGENFMKVEPIYDADNNLKGVEFTDEKGKTIDVKVNYLYSDCITISGDDSIQILPWATNLIRVKHV